MSLRVQLVLLQAVIVCLAVLVTGMIAAALQERSIRGAYQDRMVAVAQSVAHLPAIEAALADADPSAYDPADRRGHPRGIGCHLRRRDG